LAPFSLKMRSAIRAFLRVPAYVRDLFRGRKAGVIGYIDGLNLGHATEHLDEPDLQLCDPIKLLRTGLKPTDSLVSANYYIAIPRHRGELVKNGWLVFIRALEQLGVRVVRGRFKKKKRTVSVSDPAVIPHGVKTHFKITLHEEKETDVNIAIDMIADAKDGKCDTMILVSGDSDFLPIVRYLLGIGIRVVVLAPPFQKVVDFRSLAQERPKELTVRQLDLEDIRASQLDDPVRLKGKRVRLFP